MKEGLKVLGSVIKGGLFLAVEEVGVSAMIDEESDNILTSLGTGHHEGSSSTDIQVVDIGLCLNKRLDDLHVTNPASEEESSVSLMTLDIRIGSMREKDLDDRDAAVLACNHQRGLAVTLLHVDLDALDCDKEADEVFFLTGAGDEKWKESMSETEIDIDSSFDQFLHLLHVSRFTHSGKFFVLVV